MNARNRKLVNTKYVCEIADLIEGSFRVRIAVGKDKNLFWDSSDFKVYEMPKYCAKYIIYNNNGDIAFEIETLEQAKRDLRDLKEIINDEE